MSETCRIVSREMSEALRSLASCAFRVAPRRHSPLLPHRRIGYRPKADDPDRTAGRERWPKLAEWQARLSDDGNREPRADG